MGKISPVSSKYIIHTAINIDGIVDRPDVIGAIFGQTEGLLGSELELRELQRSGRIGRIEVSTETKGGKTAGTITVPSSLDKVETAIIGAALETIQRIGPCNSKVRVENIEDVRVSKRDFVIERAKELLRDLTTKVLPDSREITDLVAHSVRMMEITEYGEDRLAAGPAIDESDEIVVVEGRADVLNLLKYGIKNGIALNGTNISETIKMLGKKKVLIVFVDGDRGGDIIIKGLINAGVEIDFVTKAPDGKEVEEITKKEIHKALRSKIAIEQVKMEIAGEEEKPARPERKFTQPSEKMSGPEADKFKKLLDDLVGTRGAYILDEKLNILGKVPVTEMQTTIQNLSNIHAIVFDGYVDRNLAATAERADIKYLIAMNSRINPQQTKVKVLTSSNF